MDQLRDFGSLRQVARKAVNDLHFVSEIDVRINLRGLAKEIYTKAMSCADAVGMFAPPPIKAVLRRAAVYQVSPDFTTILTEIMTSPDFESLRNFDQPFDETTILILPMSKRQIGDDIDRSENGDPAVLHFIMRDGDTYGHGMITAGGRAVSSPFDEVGEKNSAEIAKRMIDAWWLLLCNENTMEVELTPKFSRKRLYRSTRVVPVKSFFQSFGFRSEDFFPITRDQYQINEKGQTVMTAKNSWMEEMISAIPACTPSRSDVRIFCSKDGCKQGTAVSLTKSLLPPEVILKKFQQRGWRDVTKKPVCPTCQEKEKPVSKLDPIIQPVGDDNMQNASPDAKKQHRKIMEALFLTFDEEAKRYSKDYSDQRVAEETGAPVSAVKKCREDYFGTLAIPDEVDVVKGMIAEAERQIANLRASTEDRIKAMETEVDKLRQVWSNIARANGWQ